MAAPTQFLRGPYSNVTAANGTIVNGSDKKAPGGIKRWQTLTCHEPHSNRQQTAQRREEQDDCPPGRADLLDVNHAPPMVSPSRRIRLPTGSNDSRQGWAQSTQHKKHHGWKLHHVLT